MASPAPKRPRRSPQRFDSPPQRFHPGEGAPHQQRRQRQRRAAFAVRDVKLDQPLPVIVGGVSQADLDERFPRFDLIETVGSVAPVAGSAVRAGGDNGSEGSGSAGTRLLALPPCVPWGRGAERADDPYSSSLPKKYRQLLRVTPLQAAADASVDALLAASDSKQQYKVQRRNLLEDPTVFYEPDEDDHSWCLAREIPLRSLQDVFTQLESSHIRCVLHWYNEHLRSAHSTDEAAANGKIQRGVPHCSPDVRCLPTPLALHDRCVVCGEGVDMVEDGCACRCCGLVCHVDCCSCDGLYGEAKDFSCTSNGGDKNRNKKLHPRKWQCDVCAAGKSPDTVRCKLCAKTGGLFVHLEGAKGRSFVHVVCMYLLPEARMSLEAHEASVGPLDRKRTTLVCSICRVPGGQCVECCHPQCHAGLHPTCAAAAGLVERRYGGSGFVTGADSRRFASGSNRHFSAGASGGVVRAYCESHYREFSCFVVPEGLRWLTFGTDLGRDSEREAITTVTELVRRGDDAVARAHLSDIVHLWRRKRQQQRMDDETIADLINRREVPLVARILRPGILRLGGDGDRGGEQAVRVSCFSSLVPAYQLHLSMLLEGAVPQLDTDAPAPAKTTRSGGNSFQLLRRMEKLRLHIDCLSNLVAGVVARDALKRDLVDVDLQLVINDFYHGNGECLRNVGGPPGGEQPLELPRQRRRRE